MIEGLRVSDRMMEFYAQQAERAQRGETTTFQQLGAAFSRFNTASWVQDIAARPDFEDDPDFDPIGLLTPAEIARDGHRLASARSRAELDWLRQERQRLDRLDEILAEGPLHPLIPGLVASVIDPVNLLPIGWAAAPIRGVGALARIGQAGLVGAAGTAMLEPLFHEADPFRTTYDSITDILLGGAIGAGLGGVVVGTGRILRGPPDPPPGISRERLEQARVETDMVLRDAADAFSGGQLVGGRPVDPSAPQPQLPSPASGRSVGAQDAGQTRIMDQALRDVGLETAGPRWIRNLGQALSRTAVTRYPALTLITSRFASARQFIADTFDAGVQTKLSARQMTQQDFQVAYQRAADKGWVGTEEEFIALAQQRAAVGLAQTDGLTVQAATDIKRGRFANLADEFVSAHSEARAAGDTRTRDQFDDDLTRLARYLEEPHRFPGGNPFQNHPQLPQMMRVLDAWDREIAKPALAEIQRSGVWDNVLGERPEVRARYFPKGFDTERVLADLGGFKDRWIGELTAAVDRARNLVNTHEKDVRDYVGRGRAVSKFLDGARDVVAQGLDPNGVVAAAARILRLERRTAQKVQAVQAEIQKATGRTAAQWEARLYQERAQGNSPPRGSWDDVMERRLNSARRARNKAENAYRAHLARHENDIRGAGLEPPAVRGLRPERPPGFDEARILVRDPEKGLASPQAIEREAEKIVHDIAFGADPSRHMEIGVRANLKGRGLDIDPERFGDYMTSSFLRSAENYNTMVARDVAVYSKFGTLDSAVPVGRIADEARVAQEAALARGDKKEAARIARDAQRDIDLVMDLWAKLRGTFNRPRTAGEQRFQAAVSTAMQVSYMSKMGSGLLAQIGDVATAVLRYGAARVFGAHLNNMARGFATTRELKPRARLVSTALDGALNDHQRALFDVAPNQFSGPVGRTVERMTPMFSKLTLMPLWNDTMRRTMLGVVDDMLVRASLALRKGQAIDRDAAELISRSGIDYDTLRRLSQVLEQHHTRRAGPTAMLDSNLEAWMVQFPDLSDAYRGALHVGAQRSLLVPGAGDAPMWTQKVGLNMIAQFKRFVIASLPQQFLPFMQSPAGRKMEVIIFGLALGALATTLRDLNARGEVKERSAVEWVFDAADMSGITSALTEADATFDRLTSGLSVKRMLTGEDYSRFQERTAVMQLLGPIAGMAQAGVTALSIPSRALDPDSSVGQAQITAARSLIPYQNWLLGRHGLDALEGAIGGRATGPAGRFLYPEEWAERMNR